MIQVWTSGTKSGVLNRLKDSVSRFSFTYDPSIGEESAVSITMPVRPESWIVAGGLHPVFDMNLPEGALRHWLERSFSKVVPSFDDLELLRITGCCRIGRLRYGSFGRDSAEEDVPAISIGSILLHRGADSLLEDLLRTYAVHSGVSGVQPKVMVRAEEAQELLFGSRSLTFKAPTHIVKTWTSEYPELALNEYLCLSAAKRAQLPTAKARLSEDGRFIIIDRFDLQEDGRFIGFEDCCVLQGLVSRRKYDSSYEKVAKTILSYILPDAKEDAMREFFGSVALSILVKNGNAHLKNFGILYDSPVSRRGKLAPVYDIVSTLPYQPRDMMALTMGGTKRWPDKKKLESFGKQNCGLPKRDVEGILEAVAEGISQTLPDIERSIRNVPAFAPVGRAMLNAWQDGLATIGRRYSPGFSGIEAEDKTDLPR